MTVIPHWLNKQADLRGEELAVETHAGDRYSFSDLKRMSQQRARQLRSLGMGEGSHVGLFSENNVEMIVTIHALSYLGAVIVLLNRRLTAGELAYQLKDAEVEAVLVSDGLAADFLAMGLPVDAYAYGEIARLEAAAGELVRELDLDQPFTMMYTSGTTGRPKAVVHSYGNHWFSAISSALNLGLQARDKWLCMLPIFHVSGFSICMRSVIYGMPLYLLERFSEAAVHEAIRQRGVTLVSVVTVMLERLLATIGEEAYPAHFRCFLLGGGACPLASLERARDLGLPVFQSYGMTETSSQIVTLSPEDALKKLGSAGKPLAAAQLKIVEPDAEGVGEIYVKGPMVSKGYYRQPEANAASFVDGWLGTGDLGYLDEAGYLYVVDRRHDLIISGGENIYPTEVEHVLLAYPGLEDVGVVGRADEAWGEVPVAFVVCREGNQPTEADLRAYLADRLAPYKQPVDYYFVRGLPRNVSNKLMRHRLKERLEEMRNVREEGR